jgi:hypothetical protein
VVRQQLFWAFIIYRFGIVGVATDAHLPLVK